MPIEASPERHETENIKPNGLASTAEVENTVLLWRRAAAIDSLNAVERDVNDEAKRPKERPDYDEDELSVSDDEDGSYSHRHDHKGDRKLPHSHHSDSEHDHHSSSEDDEESSHIEEERKSDVRRILRIACSGRGIKDKCFIVS